MLLSDADPESDYIISDITIIRTSHCVFCRLGPQGRFIISLTPQKKTATETDIPVAKIYV